ncbi:hypothetical protein GCM10009839_15450 [Catenulispora yoronensis]|uniref:Aromatic ring-opening dioxygenase LigA n=1 Tax=Catenulispora yoronensis TaxID=450799 RepID=A0ABN2TSS0_9ACTN
MPGRLRSALCAVTIVAAVPYLTLKALWICGVGVGVHGSALRGGAMAGANAVTVLMDGTAVAVALALVRPWGLRVPAWVLVFPMWVATGFLAPVVVGAPVAALAGAASGGVGAGGRGGGGTESLSGWVFALVYGGFGVQGVALAGGFVLHVRDRWGRLFALRLCDLPGGVVDGVRRTLVTGVGVFALVPIGVHLYWAAGGAAGHPADPDGPASRFVLESVFALVPLAGVIGAVILVRRRDGAPARWALVAAWTGTAAMFSWGLWWELAGTVPTPVTRGEDLRGIAGVGAAQMLAGAVLATALALLVVEASARRECAAGPGSTR